MFQLNISLNVDFIAIKPPKSVQNRPYLSLQLLPNFSRQKSFTPYIFQYFRLKFGSSLSASIFEFRFQENLAKVEILKSKQIVNCQIKLRSHIQNFLVTAIEVKFANFFLHFLGFSGH